ncbi:MAG: LacI family DNA-binding transcriptional regulator [Spirochaetota bacterium]
MHADTDRPKHNASSGTAGTRVTVYDVAEAAGTSVSTVSRVLNGSALIAEGTRRAVLETAERLGYEQRRVRRQAARSVLNIVVFLPLAAEPHAHLFYDAAALFAGIQDGLGEIRAHTIAALSGSTSPFEGKKLGDVDGCIFAFASPDARLREILGARGVPAVVINRLDEEYACVVNDHVAGMRAIAREIVARRADPRPVFVSVDTARPVADYRWSALREQRTLPIGAGDARRYATIAEITPAEVSRTLDAGYDTFVCANDLVAIAVFERLVSLGVAVPERVGITGYDAAPVRGLISRPIASVDLAVARLGREAADRLVHAILARSFPSGRVMIPGAVIGGESL